MDPIELEYDDMNSVPEAFRPLYTENGGKAVLTGINGLKTQKDVDNVSEALRKEREDRQKLEKDLKPWKGLDPTEVRTKLDRIGELETAAGGKLDDDAINKIVERRINGHTAPLQRQIEELTETANTLASERDAAVGTIKDMRMTSAIRTAATDAKILATAIPDVEIIAKTAFEFSDDGKLVTKEGFGVAPGLGLEAYFKEMQRTRPHWWPPSAGGGAGGGGAMLPGGEGNPWADGHWNMTRQGQLVRENPEQAAQLAKAAGSYIGATKPTKKS